MKKLFTLMFLSIFIMSNVLITNAEEKIIDSNSKEKEFNEFIEWTKDNNAEVEIGDYSSALKEVIEKDIDFENLKDFITSSQQEIEIESSENDNIVFNESKKTRRKRSVDERLLERVATIPYEGRTTSEGKRYNYTINVIVRYDCLQAPNSYSIESISNIDSNCGDASFLRSYEHKDAGKPEISRDGKKAVINGRGRMHVGITDKFSVHFNTTFKVTLHAGDGIAW